jgi:NAD(P)-dependent dehydrogenase (short-subunit alcohol dehydrogenase family)
MVAPLGARGIRINEVRFGTILSEAAKRLHEADTAHFARLTELSALGRLASPLDAAQAILSIIDARILTGTTVTADYGQSVPGNHTQ